MLSHPAFLIGVGMTSIPLGRSDHVRPFAGRPPILVWNSFFETDPANQIDQVSLIRRPAIRKLAEIGDGPIRKIYYRRDLFDNDFFVVSGELLLRVTRTGPTDFEYVEIFGPLASLYEPSLAASGENLFVTDQEQLFYTDGVAPLSLIVTPDDVPISRLLYIGGFVILIVKGGQRFYWIEPGEVTIDPLNFAEAEASPDSITDALVLGDQIYYFGGNTVEVWFLSGDAAAPFQRVQGRLMEVGVLSGSACVIPNTDTFFFISADGTARVGASLQRVSNPGIEERLRYAIQQSNLANI